MSDHIQQVPNPNTIKGRVYQYMQLGDKHGTTPNEIARRLNMSRTEVARCIEQLAREGLCKRAPTRWIANEPDEGVWRMREQESES